MNAKKGDVVVCIDDKPSSPGILVMVKAGTYYTVTATTVTPGSGRPAYELEGVVFPKGHPLCGQPYPQGQYRFKKIDGKHEFDFRKLLGQAPLSQPKSPEKVDTPDLVDA